MSRTMNQVLAVEKGVKVRTAATIADLKAAAQQPALFNGFNKTYRALEENGLTQPPASQKVQQTADGVFEVVRKSLTELFDVTATKDVGNRSAVADIIVDGTVILKEVPATYLLFLDKQLGELRDLITRFTELANDTEWQSDPNTGLFRSGTALTYTTTKRQKPLVLAPATEHHPAQTQLITEDIVVGEWTNVKHSGAIPAPRKKQLIERVQKLIDATKVALERANMTPVTDVKTGAQVLSYIFGV